MESHNAHTEILMHKFLLKLCKCSTFVLFSVVTFKTHWISQTSFDGMLGHVIGPNWGIGQFHKQYIINASNTILTRVIVHVYMLQ